MAEKGLHTHTQIYYVNDDGVPHTSAASVSDNQTCQIIQKEKDSGYESEYPYAPHVIFDGSV